MAPGPGMGPGPRERGGMERADANNDGNITREEFLARPIEQFERLDANKDGVIDAGERPQRPGRGEGPERRAGEPGRGPVNPDADNDGRVTQAEFAAAGTSMFDRLDANHDNRVTREEVEAGRPPRREGN